MEQESRGVVDQAALWSASLAAVITLSLGEGRYDWLSFALGVTLALQIATFYRPARHEPGSRGARGVAAAGFGAVGGLVGTMVLAWPVQIAVGTPSLCHRMDAAGEADLADCAGDAAYPWLGVVWLTSALVLGCWHWFGVVERQPSPDRTGPEPTGPEPAAT
ncbi:hypothetical protein ACFY8W_34200 [Streptomyces sp. NPDC012637]|uniref:hypothetical protein n=1 Tax=Streptomyces sp. NPDC012637 TaxID=3364842 RepID=UPI0036EECA66